MGISLLTGERKIYVRAGVEGLVNGMGGIMEHLNESKKNPPRKADIRT